MFHSYPYTDFHEANLDWFLSKFKSLIAEWEETKKEFSSVKEAFAALKTYVENYFDNLDVQQEINNKLDEMYADGTLVTILANYALRPYDTVADMKEDAALRSGMNVVTMGYWAVNDGGNATYKIRDVAPAGYSEILENGLFAELITDNTLNVRQVGCKGDNTDDIAPIINNVTADYSLYFPPGVYNVASRIELKNSIFGDLKIGGSTNFAEMRDKYAVLMCSYDAADSTDGVINISNDCNDLTIKGINICPNRHTISGISCKISTAKYHTIDNVFINALYKGAAIYWHPTVTISKPIEVTSLYVIGTNVMEGNESQGINIDNCADCRFSMITMMAVRQGVIQNGHMSFWENVHIWGGCISYGANNAYWNSSRGFRLTGDCRIYATNLYMDTFQTVFSSTSGKNRVDVTNFVYWYDDVSAENVSNKNGSLLYEGANSPCYLNINGGRIYGDGNLRNIVTPLHVTMENVEMRTDNDFTTTLWSSYPVMPRYKLMEQNIQHSNVPSGQTRYVEIAKIWVAAVGYSEFIISKNDVSCNIKIHQARGGSVTIDKTFNLGSVLPMYYKLDGNVLTIYIEETEPFTWTITPVTVSQYHLTIIYELLARKNGDNYVPEVLSSNSGLISF